MISSGCYRLNAYESAAVKRMREICNNDPSICVDGVVTANYVPPTYGPVLMVRDKNCSLYGQGSTVMKVTDTSGGFTQMLTLQKPSPVIDPTTGRQQIQNGQRVWHFDDQPECHTHRPDEPVL
jgi:hypothetical protein